MTKVQIRLTLMRPIDDVLMARVAEAHAIYGIYRILPDGTGSALEIEYDASRLRPPEVEAALHRAGIPVSSPGT
jgi:hypothetical protein